MGLDDQAQERTIDGITYRVWPIPFGVGKKALLRLMRIAAPILTAMAESEGGTAWQMGAAVIAKIPAAMSDDDVEYFAKLFGDASSFVGEQGTPVMLSSSVQNLHFAARYPAFIAWLMYGAEVNFSSFFSGETLKTAVESLKSLAKKAA